MKIKVLLFAALRDRIGQRELQLEPVQMESVDALKQRIAQLYPDAADLIQRSAVAIDQKYATADQAVPADAEVALIPPVSGG